MTLREFRSLLSDHTDKKFQIRLPGGDTIPESFHITEVGRLQKSFIDCGGTEHHQETCVLQVWLGQDEDHRLAAGKLAGILGKAERLLPNQDIPLEIECETGLISQYAVPEAAITDSAVILQLAGKHTDCLAREVCGVSERPAAAACGCGPSCC